MKRSSTLLWGAAVGILTSCAGVGDDEAAFDALDETDQVQQAAARGQCQTAAECDDSNPCTADLCIDGKCRHSNLTTPCDDGDACTLGDQCQQGACQGAQSSVLLSGAVLPDQQAWTHYSFNNATSTNGSWVTIDTASLMQNNTYEMWGKSVPSSVFVTHDLVFKLQTYVADHNPFDASVAFLPAYSGWYGSNTERPQLIYFEEDRVGWGDESASYLVSTLVSRLYRLHVTPSGTGEFYVDGQLALSRPGLLLNGNVGFGDQTNDPGVSGRFDIYAMSLVPNSSCQ